MELEIRALLPGETKKVDKHQGKVGAVAEEGAEVGDVLAELNFSVHRFRVAGDKDQRQSWELGHTHRKFQQMGIARHHRESMQKSSPLCWKNWSMTWHWTRQAH